MKNRKALLLIFDNAKRDSLIHYTKGMNNLLKNSKLYSLRFMKQSTFPLCYDLDKVHQHMMEWFNKEMFKEPNSIAKLMATIYVYFGFNGDQCLMDYNFSNEDLDKAIQKINTLLPEICHINEAYPYSIYHSTNHKFYQLLNVIGSDKNLTSESYQNYKEAEQKYREKIARKKYERLEQVQNPNSCDLVVLQKFGFPAKKIKRIFRINTLAQMLTLWEDDNDLFFTKLGLAENCDEINKIYCYLVSLGIKVSIPKLLRKGYDRQSHKLETKIQFLNSKEILQSFINELTDEESKDVLEFIKNTYPDKFSQEKFIDVDFLCFTPSTRLYNSLKRNGTTQMLSGVLAIENMEQLRKIRNLGEKSICELKEIMIREGYEDWVKKVFINN